MSDQKIENTEQLTNTIAEVAQQAVDLPAELLREELEQASAIYQLVIDFLTNYSFQLIGAVLIFLVGFFFAGKIAKVVLRICEKKKIDITLSYFLASMTKITVMTVVCIIVLSKIGISVTPLIAALGAASFGAVLALQGLLSNYAAGFNIIMSRPFVIDDTIEILGVTGIVKEVRLGFTIIQDENGAKITIPNKHIVGEVMLNSKKDTLLKLSVGISYQDNPIEVTALIERTLAALDIYADEVRMQVGIDEFSDSAITIGIRLWIPTNHLYATKYNAYKAIYLAFEQEKITIPFPQQDIHIIEQNKLKQEV
ncbi:MAG: mechanosensitive ion channel family protein [Colwellia sp.]